MIPPTRRAALVEILDHERRVKQLTLESYRQWLPHARAAVLPTTVTAAAEDEQIPPDPEALGLTQGQWEAILAGVFLAGMADILWERITANLNALGITIGETARLTAEAVRLLRPDEDDDTPRGRQRPTSATRRPRDSDQPPPIVFPPMGGDEDTSEPPEPEPERPDQDQPGRGEQRDDDEPLTPEFVIAIPSTQEFVEAYLAAVNNRMVRTPDTAFRLIADELAEATRLGESIQQQRERVARILDEQNLETFGGRRAALVARTETAGALNASRLEAARVTAAVTGEVLEKAWLSTIDGRTRATHFATDGQRVPIDGVFTLPGGTEMRWPGEPGAPASEVCNCRCSLMILAPDEDLPSEYDRQTERGPGNATVRNRAGSRQDEIDRRREEDGIVRARDDPDNVGYISAAGAPSNATIRSMQTFTAVLAHLGVLTDDGRLLAESMDLRFRDTPLPLRWQRQDVPEHMEAFTVAVIDSIGRDGTQIVGAGHMLDTPEAVEAALQIREGVTAPSVDLADLEWELRDQHGNLLTDESDLSEDTKMVFTVTSAVVTAATLVSIPAFGNTSIALDEPAEPGEVTEDEEALVAAAAAPPFRPAGALFSDPGFTEPTPLHITKDGRVQGHLAVFGVCHVGISDRCVTAPRSVTGYAHFHTSSVDTADGVRLPVGRLTVDTGHASHQLGARAAAEHYDNTGTCWAYVRAGEDAHGIWVSGVVHPDATESQIHEGLSAPLSGDWRSIGGNLELVAALSVNTPGFPVLRGREEQQGRPAVLVASLSPRQSRPPVDTAVLRAVAVEAVREYRTGESRRAKARQLIQQHRRTEARALVAAARREDH